MSLHQVVPRDGQYTGSLSSQVLLLARLSALSHLDLDLVTVSR